MKKMLTATLFLVFIILAGPACAEEINCFGPKQYVHTAGKPVVFTDTFEACSGAARMVVVNGDADGDQRISSARIVLNGIQIFGPQDFNRHADMLLAESAETTHYALTAAGPCGTVAAEAILTVVPAPAPSIRIIQPFDGAEIGSRMITVSGTVSMPGARVTVNGTPALVTNSMFVAENIQLNFGRNALTAVAASGDLRAESTITVLPGLESFS